ncbi:hypothetical protein IT575_12165 [bacterium]|nr:hypothetical protein [bacterium]
MTNAATTTDYSPGLIAEAQRLGISAERYSKLSDPDRVRFERKAARMLQPEDQQKAKAPKPKSPQARKKAARRSAIKDSGPLFVLAKRQRPVRSGDGRLTRSPGDIIPHPDQIDRQLLDGAAEPLAAWWGGQFKEPERVDGKLYPALRLRPADKRVWIQDEPLRLIELDEASNGLALAAIKRCWEAETLERVPSCSSRTLLREAAAARLANPYSDGKRPMSLLLDGRSLTVLQENLEYKEATELREVELKQLIAVCEDEQVLLAVIGKRSLSDNHEDARKRVALLRAEAQARKQAEEKAEADAKAKAEAGASTVQTESSAQTTGTEPQNRTVPQAGQINAAPEPATAPAPPKQAPQGKGKK